MCGFLWMGWFYRTKRNNFICSIILPNCKTMGAFTQIRLPADNWFHTDEILRLSLHKKSLLLILVQDITCLTTSRNRNRQENIPSGLCSKGFVVPSGVLHLWCLVMSRNACMHCWSFLQDLVRRNMPRFLREMKCNKYSRANENKGMLPLFNFCICASKMVIQSWLINDTG